MLGKLRPRCAYDVVAMVAFFLAVTGAGAYAAATIGAGDIRDDAVRSRHVRDGAVHNDDLAASSVGSGKVIDHSLQGRDFKLGALDHGASYYVTWDLPAKRESEEKTIVEKGPFKLSAICRQDLTSATDKVSLTIHFSSSKRSFFTAATDAREANGFGRTGTTAAGGPGKLVVADVPRQTSFFWYGGAPFSAIGGDTTLDGILSYGVLSYHHCEVSFFGG